MRTSLCCYAALGAAVALCTNVAPAAATHLVFTASLTSGQVVSTPPSASAAVGFATVVLDALTGTTTVPYTMTTDFAWSGLSGPADRSHVHDAPLGGTTSDLFFHEVLYTWWPSDPQGPAVVCFTTPDPCVPATGSTHDVLNVDSSNISSYLNFGALVSLFESGGMYIDIHNELYPSGEIRGQFAAAIPEPAGMGGLALVGALAASLRWPRRPGRGG